MTSEFLSKANNLHQEIERLKHAIKELEGFDFVKVNGLDVKKTDSVKSFSQLSAVYSEKFRISTEKFLEKKRRMLIFELKVSLDNKIKEFEEL